MHFEYLFYIRNFMNNNRSSTKAAVEMNVNWRTTANQQQMNLWIFRVDEFKAYILD